jgi:predicted dehydrogenase
VQKLKRLVDLGIAGRAYLATIETAWKRGDDYYAVPWRRTWKGSLGGCLLGHAVHAHDLLCYINGPVSRVQAFARTLVNPIETEDCAAASLEMADGSLASLSVTLGSARELTHLRFYFENLMAASNATPYDFASDPWEFAGASPEIDRRIREALKDFVPGPEGYVAQFLDAHDAMHGRRAGLTGLADARKAVELATAMYHSALHGTVVKLPLRSDHPAYNGFRAVIDRPFGSSPTESAAAVARAT